MAVPKPNAKYPHVHVVIRIDWFQGPLDDQAVTVTSVFGSEEAAVAEADRLNGLVAERGVESQYFVRVGRLKD